MPEEAAGARGSGLARMASTEKEDARCRGARDLPGSAGGPGAGEQPERGDWGWSLAGLGMASPWPGRRPGQREGRGRPPCTLQLGERLAGLEAPGSGRVLLYSAGRGGAGGRPFPCGPGGASGGLRGPGSPRYALRARQGPCSLGSYEFENAHPGEVLGRSPVAR